MNIPAERSPDGIPNVERLPSFLAGRWAIVLAGVVLAFSVLAAYHAAFPVPFLFDDVRAITENPTIRHLWPVGPVLSPPADGRTVSGRPLVNLSLAVNYALGGMDVWGYHALNLAAHILASLILFGIVRRTLLLNPVLRERFETAALPLALVVTLLWALHPLQTESVTYVVQRAESLMGLFYLLTLYAFIRGTEAKEEGRNKNDKASAFCIHLSSFPQWYALAIVACLLGMATKEVMVSAPLVVWLYDRTFLAGTFREALRLRWRVYAGLGAGWLLLACLVVWTGELGSERAGFQTAVSCWSYALTQLWAIAHYLRLSVWPNPLVFDYGTQLVTNAAQVVPSALLVMALGAGVIFLECPKKANEELSIKDEELSGPSSFIIHNSAFPHSAVGFLGIWFFAILAPTSSVIPLVGQTVAEHRMYLPLAAVVTLAVLGVYSCAVGVGARSLASRPERKAEGKIKNEETRLFCMLPSSFFLLALAVAIVLGLLTARRNEDYRSEVAIWSDTVAKRPHNARAHNNLGNALFQLDRVQESIGHYKQALQINPHYAEAYNNTGVALFRLGMVSEAITYYEQALRLGPDFGRAHCNLGAALLQLRRLPEAIEHLERGVQLRPDDAEAHNNLGAALVQAGELREGLEHLEQAVRLKPEDATAQFDLANVLFQQDRISEAVAHYQHALRVKPDNAEAHKNLAGALMEQDRVAEAAGHLERALQIEPRDAAVHCLLGVALCRLGKASKAVDHLEQALRFKAGHSEAGRHLAWMLATCGEASIRNGVRAVELAEQANQAAGGKDSGILNTLAAAYAEAGRFGDAVRTAESAVKLAKEAESVEALRRIEERLRIYQTGQPYHEGTTPAP